LPVSSGVACLPQYASAQFTIASIFYKKTAGSNIEACRLIFMRST
jgi:hypothetical protein